MLFILLIVFLVFALKSFVHTSIDMVIDINGAVLGFIFIYLLPSMLHIKCTYFPKGKKLLVPAVDNEEAQQKSKYSGVDNSLKEERENRIYEN